MTEGVYNNPPFMHSATGQVGNVAQIMTASGQVWEGKKPNPNHRPTSFNNNVFIGVFKTYSPNFDAVFEVVTRVENPDGPDSRLLAETLRDTLIFSACDILNITLKNVDMDYPIKDTFQVSSVPFWVTLYRTICF